MKVPKQEILSVLTRVGRGDVIEKAKRDLPDTIDTDNDIDQQRLFESASRAINSSIGWAEAPNALTSPEPDPRIAARLPSSTLTSGTPPDPQVWRTNDAQTMRPRRSTHDDHDAGKDPTEVSAQGSHLPAFPQDRRSSPERFSGHNVSQLLARHAQPTHVREFNRRQPAFDTTFDTPFIETAWAAEFQRTLAVRRRRAHRALRRRTTATFSEQPEAGLLATKLARKRGPSPRGEAEVRSRSV
jgi:hypothetical protein